MKAPFYALCGAVLCIQTALAEDNDKIPAKGIQDNSFLIEEAYNQEPGVVQHITNLRRQGRQWQFSFSQEWPVFSQTHQLSYSIPYNFGKVQGLGEVGLNYRYQLQTETDLRPAIASRISLILPASEAVEGIEEKELGYEFLLPISKVVTDRITLNANLGFRSFFDVAGHQPTIYRLGGSGIYAITRDTNILLETIADWVESVNNMGRLERDFELTVLPGIRHAINFTDDSQLVIGAGVPFVFSNHSVDTGLFFYLSFEHKFTR